MDYNRLMRDTPKNHSTLDEITFKELVKLDIQNRLTEVEARPLRKDLTAVKKWLQELRQLNADMSTQFSQRKSNDTEYKKELKLRYSGKELADRWSIRRNETAQWKRKAVRFRENLHLRYTEAKELYSKMSQPQPKKKSERDLEQVKIKKSLFEIAELLRHEQSAEELEANRKYILSLIERTVGETIKEMFNNQDLMERREKVEKNKF
ncbi:hypothetical protein [Peribacillus sp. NPDC096448]|uniref:hypothetical protein n=1 Tax=Peribacillus sp. NPDC096448 TaxID=3364395 RepID=UPI003824D29A